MNSHESCFSKCGECFFGLGLERCFLLALLKAKIGQQEEFAEFVFVRANFRGDDIENAVGKPLLSRRGRKLFMLPDDIPPPQ